MISRNEVAEKSEDARVPNLRPLGLFADQFVIKNEFSALIERHARYLMSVPALAIRVEGNTDERGSTEYNLSLGQRRAEAVRKAPEVAGVTGQYFVDQRAVKSSAASYDEAAAKRLWEISDAMTGLRVPA